MTNFRCRKSSWSSTDEAVPKFKSQTQLWSTVRDVHMSVSTTQTATAKWPKKTAPMARKRLSQTTHHAHLPFSSQRSSKRLSQCSTMVSRHSNTRAWLQICCLACRMLRRAPLPPHRRPSTSPCRLSRPRKHSPQCSRARRLRRNRSRQSRTHASAYVNSSVQSPQFLSNTLANLIWCPVNSPCSAGATLATNTMIAFHGLKIFMRPQSPLIRLILETTIMAMLKTAAHMGRCWEGRNKWHHRRRSVSTRTDPRACACQT